MMRQGCCLFLGCLSFASLTFACGPGDTEPDELTFCDVEPIFAEKCERCHTDPLENGAPFPLRNYEEIAPEVDLIYSAVESGLMPATFVVVNPPVEDLTGEERQLLLDWIDEGAEPGDCE